MRTLFCVALISFVISGNIAFARGAAEAEIEEVFIDERRQPRTDIWVKIRWTGSGDQQANSQATLQVQQATFGERGVSRLQSLFLSALLSGKTVWIRFDDSNHVKAAFLKSKRNG